MEEESNAEPEKEQPNLNTSVEEEEEENYDEEEDYDEDEEADYEEDFSEEEDVLKSALASFTLLPQTTVRKVVEELEVLGGCPDRLVARGRGRLGEEGEDRMEVIRGRLEVADHAIGTPERASK